MSDKSPGAVGLSQKGVVNAGSAILAEPATPSGSFIRDNAALIAIGLLVGLVVLSSKK